MIHCPVGRIVSLPAVLIGVSWCPPVMEEHKASAAISTPCKETSAKHL